MSDAPAVPQSYSCDFCKEIAAMSCATCGKRFCMNHGHYEAALQPADTPRCGECHYLKLYGDTYQLQIAGNYVVESIDSVADTELSQMLELYERKVRDLEVAIASARRQTGLLKNRLRLGRAPSATPKAPRAASKPKEPAQPVDIDALAAKLNASGIDLATLLAQLQGGKK